MVLRRNLTILFEFSQAFAIINIMTLIEQAIELIEKHRDFDEEVAECLKSPTGYMYKSPTCFVLANYDPIENELIIHFVVGNLIEMLNKIHMIPKIITFEKHGNIKSYNYQKFIKRFNLS